jgi:hypothetical protein
MTLQKPLCGLVQNLQFSGGIVSLRSTARACSDDHVVPSRPRDISVLRGILNSIVVYSETNIASFHPLLAM